MATHRVLYQEWESRDSWSGPQKIAGSLHLDKADRDSYIREQYGDRSGPATEYYILAVGDAKWVEVDDETFAKVEAGQPGIRAVESVSASYRAL